MTDLEIELLVEKVARKAADCAIDKAKKLWQLDIELHTAECAANKYRGVKTLFAAVSGGGIVALINWILRK